MKAVNREDFLRWAATVGVGFDPLYPDARRLCLLTSREQARFWVRPPDPATWPHFVASLLAGLDEWDSGLLWPHSGSWPSPQQSQLYNEGVRHVLLKGAGIPPGWAGAVRFGREEEGALVAVLYAYLAFGWCVDDDLFFIPAHGRQLLQTDHHDVVYVECLSEERVQSLVEHMAQTGYPLPSQPPDWTFKWPSWMVRTEHS